MSFIGECVRLFCTVLVGRIMVRLLITALGVGLLLVWALL